MNEESKLNLEAALEVVNSSSAIGFEARIEMRKILQALCSQPVAIPRRIRLKIVRVCDDGNLEAQIVEQSHRYPDFERFKASNGIVLDSENHPSMEDNNFWLRGNVKVNDNNFLYFTPRRYADVLDAIKEWEAAG